MGKYAAENSNGSELRQVSGKFEALGESTVRMLSQLSKGGGKEVKKRKDTQKRPLTLSELDGDVQ